MKAVPLFHFGEGRGQCRETEAIRNLHIGESAAKSGTLTQELESSIELLFLKLEQSFLIHLMGLFKQLTFFLAYHTNNFLQLKKSLSKATPKKAIHNQRILITNY